MRDATWLKSSSQQLFSNASCSPVPSLPHCRVQGSKDVKVAWLLFSEQAPEQLGPNHVRSDTYCPCSSKLLHVGLGKRICPAFPVLHFMPRVLEAGCKCVALSVRHTRDAQRRVVATKDFCPSSQTADELVHPAGKERKHN